MIEKANINRQINVNTVAEAKNIPDSTKYIKEPYSPFLDALDKADKISETNFKYLDKLSIYEDSIVANKALLQAQEDISVLNTEYMQKEGEDRINFYNKTYKNKYREILTKFNETVGPLKHANISNDVTDKLSKYNVQNCATIELDQYKTIKDVNKKVLENRRAVLLSEIQEAYRVSPVAASTTLLGKIEEARKIQAEIDAIDGILKKGERTSKLAKYNSDVAAGSVLAVAVDNVLRSENLDRNMKGAFNDAIALVDTVAKQTNIDNVVRDKIKHDAILEGLKIATKSHPEQFMKDGKVNDAIIDDMSGHLLTQEERAQLISDAISAVGKNGGALTAGEIAENEKYTDEFESFARQQLASIGIYDNTLSELSSILNSGESSTKKKKEFESEIEKIFKKAGIGKVVQVANAIDTWDEINERHIGGFRPTVDASVQKKFSQLIHKGVESFVRYVANEDFSAIDDRGFWSKFIGENANPNSSDWAMLNILRQMKAVEIKNGKYKNLKDLSEKEYVERVDLARKVLQDFDYFSSTLLSGYDPEYSSKYNTIMKMDVKNPKSNDEDFWRRANNVATILLNNEYYNEVKGNTYENFSDNIIRDRGALLEEIRSNQQANIQNMFNKTTDTPIYNTQSAVLKNIDSVIPIPFFGLGRDTTNILWQKLRKNNG